MRLGGAAITAHSPGWLRTVTGEPAAPYSSLTKLPEYTPPRSQSVAPAGSGVAGSRAVARSHGLSAVPSPAVRRGRPPLSGAQFA